MSKNVNVTYNFNRNIRTPEMRVDFVNGCSVTIPDKYGGFVIAPGCGSGKTTAILDMIIRTKHSGVLYSAATIEECNKMYRALIDRGVSKDDIIVFHSDWESEGVDMNKMRSNDDSIRNKRIVICTHHKLLHEHNEILYSFDVPRYDYNATRSHLAMTSQLTTRQNVFIDEVPTCKSLSVDLTKFDIESFTLTEYKDVLKTVTKWDPKKCEEYEVEEWSRDVIRNSDGTPKRNLMMKNDFEYAFNRMKKHLNLYEENCESNKMRNDILSDLVYDNLPSLVNSLPDKVTLTRTLSDLLYNDITTRIMIFEGTGDLTFYKSDLFEVLEVQYPTDLLASRYSSPIYVRTPIPFNIKRSYKNQKEFNDTKYLRDLEWNNIITILAGIISSDEVDENGNRIPCTGTLIQTWKGYNIKGTDPEDYANTEMTERSTFYNPEYHLPLMIKNELNRKGIVSGFEVIHFMSGLDKATNEFRNFNRVIILGNLQVPNSVVGKFNQDYRVNTTPHLFRLYQMSQLVCRTKIRMHNGDPIFIYYTEDINMNVIKDLIRYLTGTNPSNLVSQEDDLEKIGIKPKWRPAIGLLCNLDFEFKRALLNKLPYELNFTLDEIYELIPVGKREVRKYSPLINYLKGFNILLNIKSTWGRNQYTQVKEETLK